MNLRRLEYFLVLGQTGNLKRAGEILGLSAPALSKAMKVLEYDVDIRIWTKFTWNDQRPDKKDLYILFIEVVLENRYGLTQDFLSLLLKERTFFILFIAEVVPSLFLIKSLVHPVSLVEGFTSINLLTTK